MEAIQVTPSFFESVKTPSQLENAMSNFTNKGFGNRSRNLEDNCPTAIVVDHVTGKINPNICHISGNAKFTMSELDKLRKLNASQAQINTLAEILPMRVLMQKALKRKGYPVPPDISDMAQAFYDNIIKNSPVGKHFAYIEGNPVIYKMSKQNHASQAVVTSLAELVPAITSFVSASYSKSSQINDPQLIQDANDIKAYIAAKQAGMPTDNLPTGTTSMNKGFMVLLGVVVVVVLIKLIK
jgi:hypothetical protein